MLEKTLSFLADNIAIYYAGLDHEGLPFGEGERLIARTAKDQIIYLKALSLVADYIVVPPSNYFLWVDKLQTNKVLDELKLLYEAGIIISPIYSSMNMGTDFIEKKKKDGSYLDKRMIRKHGDKLNPFFQAMPVLHRNVRRQSGGFRGFLIQEMPKLKGPVLFKNRIDEILFCSQDNEILISRHQFSDQLYHAIRSNEINRGIFRKNFYTLTHL